MAIGLPHSKAKKAKEKKARELAARKSLRPWQSEQEQAKHQDLLEVILNREGKRKIHRDEAEVVLCELEGRIKKRAREIFKNLAELQGE